MKNQRRNNSPMASMTSKIDLNRQFSVFVVDPLFLLLFFLVKLPKSVSIKSCNAGALLNNELNASMFGGVRPLFFQKQSCMFFLLFSPIFSLSVFLHPKVFFQTFSTLFFLTCSFLVRFILFFLSNDVQ